MPIDNCNPNLPDVFKDCDQRVFAFAPDKLPHKDKPIHAIEYARLKYILRKLKGEYFKNRPFNGFTLTEYFLERMRKYKIDGVSYIWPYEARWETNETLAEELGGFTNPLSYRQIRTAFDQAKHYGLIHNPASQGDRLRLFRLHDELIQMAKMTDSQIAEYIIRQNKHRPQKSKYIDRRSRSTSTAEVEVHRPQKSIELNKEETKELNNIVKRTSDPSNRLVQASDEDQNNMATNLTRHKPASYEEMILSKEIATNDAVPQIHDHSSSASFRCPDVLDKRVKKRQVLKAWRDVFYERAKNTEKKDRVFSYIGDRFFVGLYNNLSNWLGEQGIHNGKVNMIEQMALVVFDQVIFTNGIYQEEFRNRCKVKKGHTFLNHQFFEEIRQKAFNSLDEREEPTLEPATAKALSLDQITAKRLSEMELAGDSDQFIADLNDKFFGHWKIKQLSSQKRDGVLIDIMTNDRSWQLIRDAWNREEFDVVFSDTMFNVLLKYSDTFKGEKKNVVNLKKPMSEADQFATSLISQCVKIDRNKPKQVWVR